MLNILANVSAVSEAVAEVRVALQGINKWFDDYMTSEESEATQVIL